MRIKHFISLLLITLWSFSVSAQGLDDYFDDGGISNSRKRLKLEATSLLKGYIPVSLEYYVFDRLSLDLGAGLILPYRVVDLEAIVVEAYPYPASLGLTIKADLNWYYFRKSQNAFGMGIGYQKRYFDNYNITDYYGHSIYSLNLSGPWVIEYQVGMKLSFVEETATWNPYQDIFGWFKTSINVAYLL